MSAKKQSSRGLGRSFGSLIPTELLDESFDPTAVQDERVSELRNIKLSEISPDPDQPRRNFDEVALAELAASIAEHGVVQPIVVAPHSGGYRIVAGERRYKAALRAGLDRIPALVRTLSDQHRLELSLIENIQRADLTPIETATAYQKLRDQFNLTLDEIGHQVGSKSVSAISNTLRLLKLPKIVQQELVAGTLREGQARPLIGLDDAIIAEVLPKILKEEWSARKIEQYIVDLKRSAKEKPGSVSPNESYDDEVAELQKRFGTNVVIRSSAKGTGQIVIRFKNTTEFERIKKLLNT